MMARRLSRGLFTTMFEVNFVSGALDVCVNARACASGITFMWFVIVITHLGSALPSCFTTLFPFWKNSSIFCSSNDVAGKPNCHLCFVKGQHHRMLNALAWFGQGYEHRCCQWKKSVSATVFGHHRDQWHMTYSNYSLLFIPLCYPLILFNRMHYLCPSLDSL